MWANGCLNFTLGSLLLKGIVAVLAVCPPVCPLLWTLSLVMLKPEHSGIIMSISLLFFANALAPYTRARSWSPSHLKFCLQITWPFSIFTPSHLEAKSLGEIPSDFGSWLGDILGRSNIIICNLYFFLNQYMWHYMICFTTYLQKAVRIIFIDKLGARYHLLRQHRRLLGCYIKWRHFSVDAWGHKSVDADAWRRQQRIARKTIRCIPK